MFPLSRADLQTVPGHVNLHARYISSKAIRRVYKGRCVHLKNKAQSVGHYSIQIFIIIPGSWPREILWYCYLCFPSKAKDYENNKTIMFKKCALWQITVNTRRWKRAYFRSLKTNVFSTPSRCTCASVQPIHLPGLLLGSSGPM